MKLIFDKGKIAKYREFSILALPYLELFYNFQYGVFKVIY